MLQCYITTLFHPTSSDHWQIRHSCVARAAVHTLESETCHCPLRSTLTARPAALAARFRPLGQDFPLRQKLISTPYRRGSSRRIRGECGVTARAALPWPVASVRAHHAWFTSFGLMFVAPVSRETAPVWRPAHLLGSSSRWRFCLIRLGRVPMIAGVQPFTPIAGK